MYIKEIRGKSTSLHKFGIPIRLTANAVIFLEGESLPQVDRAVEEGLIVEVEPLKGRNNEILAFQPVVSEEE